MVVLVQHGAVTCNTCMFGCHVGKAGKQLANMCVILLSEHTKSGLQTYRPMAFILTDCSPPSDCSATSYRLCVACIGITLRSASRSLLLLVGLQHLWRLYTLLSHLSQRRGTSYLCCVCCSWKTIRVVVH